jgi:PrcB C-terminal
MERTRHWMTTRIAFVALASAGLAACAMDESGVPPDAVRLESRMLAQYPGLYGPYHEHARLLIHDAAAWEQHWSQIAVEDIPVPAVDFSRDMVVVVAMGRQRTSGYNVTVEGVFEGAEGLYIQVLETSPGSRCDVLTAVTSPVTAVAIPRSDVPVFWLERTDTRCGE